MALSLFSDRNRSFFRLNNQPLAKVDLSTLANVFLENQDMGRISLACSVETLIQRSKGIFHDTQLNRLDLQQKKPFSPRYIEEKGFLKFHPD